MAHFSRRVVATVLGAFSLLALVPWPVATAGPLPAPRPIELKIILLLSMWVQSGAKRMMGNLRSLLLAGLFLTTISPIAVAAELVIDNGAAGTSFTGRWCKSGTTAYYGRDSLYSCGSRLDTYRFTPNIAQEAIYDVYVRWTIHSNRSTSVPISVRHKSGTTSKNYNQHKNGSTWVLHGRYTFVSGMAGYVEISDQNGQASADAVRLVPSAVRLVPSAVRLVPSAVRLVPSSNDIVIDNGGPGTSSRGAWCTSGTTGHYGADSLYSCGSALDTYRFTPNIAQEAIYDVYVRWTVHPNRSTSVPISVTHKSGTTSKNYNQHSSGSTWVLHGRYTFVSGMAGYIEISDQNGQASADAVALAFVSLSPPSPTPTPTPAPTPAPMPRADIVPSSLKLGSATVNAGGTTPLQLTVANRGTATAQSVAVTISLVSGVTTSRAASLNIGTLLAGASGTVATTLTAPMLPGTYTVRAAATTPDPETSTANNTTTTTLGVASAPTPTPTPSPAPLPTPSPAISSPLRKSTVNGRYFADADGKAVYLTGMHNWWNLQDSILASRPPMDYAKYLARLKALGHNYTRLWMFESAKSTDTNGTITGRKPMPWPRTGPGMALDGQPKFDLSKFDQAYFDRLRSRVIAARDQGIYVSIMLFEGWSHQFMTQTGHPFSIENNINNIDGDTNDDRKLAEVHRVAPGSVISNLQRAYVREVIDTVNDLDNVLYEIANEDGGGTVQWQYDLINYIKSYQDGLPQQHMVGMTFRYPTGTNAELTSSPADWISPKESMTAPPVANGAKVILSDTDHHCGTCSGRNWIWKSFLRGANPIFMDNDPLNSSSSLESSRKLLGQTLAYAKRIDLANMKPRSSTSACNAGGQAYCLTKPTASAAHYLVYLPSGGSVSVDLTASQGTLKVEWLNVETGAITQAASVGGGSVRGFTAPFSGDAALYIRH